jgi:Lrp/AsnC family leucine-responsive transcriptional regulator
MNSKSVPDSIDWKILELLQRNARLSNSEIGRQVGLSQPAVTSRIQRLEDGGVIVGYGARLDPVKLGREISAAIRVHTTFEHLGACLEVLRQAPEVMSVRRLTGDDCLLIEGAFERMAQVEALIDQLAPLGDVTTSFVLATYEPKPMTRMAAKSAERKPSRVGGRRQAAADRPLVTKVAVLD